MGTFDQHKTHLGDVSSQLDEIKRKTLVMTTTITRSNKTRPAFQEAFLHYIWKTKNFNFQTLRSTTGQLVKILDWGHHNHNAGPDFLDGKIEYDGIIWAGHIEIHIKASDWYNHHHHVDPAYDQVILHVIWEDDRVVTDIHLTPITTVVLKGLVDSELVQNSAALIHSKHRLSCSHSLGNISTFWLNAWKERQLVERLEYRTGKVLNRLSHAHGDWEQVAFEFLFRSMGFHANSDAFEELAQNISWKLARKVIYDQKALEAILFGQAGLLFDDFFDHYPKALKKEYAFLKSKYSLSSKTHIKWNFKGARPANFPTVRLAQLAAILFNNASLIHKIIDASSLDNLRALFVFEVNDFWNTHYVFNKSVKRTRIKLSRSSTNLLLINYCIPLLYAYGQAQHRDELKERAIQFLYMLPQERNAVLSEFSKAGVQVRCAAETQALLHTYSEYCAPKRCLECQVGAKIIGGKS